MPSNELWSVVPDLGGKAGLKEIAVAKRTHRGIRKPKAAKHNSPKSGLAELRNEPTGKAKCRGRGTLSERAMTRFVKICVFLDHRWARAHRHYLEEKQ